MLHAPKTKPQDYGMKKTDFHLVANAATETMKAYKGDGAFLWEIACLCQGQHAKWWLPQGDTPPGVWKIGQIWDDKSTGDMTSPYGWVVFDMVDLEGREDGNGRSGLAIHGGGSGLLDPFAPTQKLLPTLGCIRIRNADCAYILRLCTLGTVYISVHQKKTA